MIDLTTAWSLGRPLVFGHRGASHNAPENTMAAFETAVTSGADGVELDVHLTADGVPVVMHNAKVDATTDGVGWIRELTVSEVMALDAGSHFSEVFAGERVPLLKDVLDAFGDRLLINIELKPQLDRTEAMVKAVADLIRERSLERRVWVSSFEPYALHCMRRVAPEVPCGLLYGPLNLASLLLAPMTPIDAFHPHFTLVAPWFVRWAHALNKRVATWTLDDPERARQMAAWGVDILITNEPKEIREAITTSQPAERLG